MAFIVLQQLEAKVKLISNTKLFVKQVKKENIRQVLRFPQSVKMQLISVTVALTSLLLSLHHIIV